MAENQNSSGIKRIVIIGPESTGKSTLSQHLAEHYETAWVPEFARQHLLTHGMSYTYDDLLYIAKQQLALEDEIASTAAHDLLFVDTNMYVMKVWCEFVFGRCDQWILDRIVDRKYDYYLLCKTDLPWVADELREYPDLESRLKLYHIYRDILINQHIPWAEISGSNEERLHRAIEVIDTLRTTHLSA
jgi:NadR type nicotinamide-nucleotide adenylyltransferase